jgi:hypothetical protein
MRDIDVGHCVPALARDYIVLLREGGYVKVIAGIVTEIVEDGISRYPEQFDLPCFDKWGNRVSRLPDMIGQFQNVGGMDDPYYWSNN